MSKASRLRKLETHVTLAKQPADDPWERAQQDVFEELERMSFSSRRTLHWNTWVMDVHHQCEEAKQRLGGPRVDEHGSLVLPEEYQRVLDRLHSDKATINVAGVKLTKGDWEQLEPDRNPGWLEWAKTGPLGIHLVAQRIWLGTICAGGK